MKDDMKEKKKDGPSATAPRALITGITGQDGSYLAELLLDKGYEVWGMIRRSSSFNTGRIDHLYKDPARRERAKLHLVYGDLNDSVVAWARPAPTSQPHEVYNLGAQSHVRVSFDVPGIHGRRDGTRDRAIARGHPPESESTRRFYQASSSELYGKVVETPQTEATPFHPRSPYAVGQGVLVLHHPATTVRRTDMFACNGILFNHESPRRGETFVTRKITRAAGRIKVGLQNKLYLGNLDAKRDWGFAGDYVEAMWLMLQADEPEDFVVATGETHSVREFLEATFGHLDLDWEQHVEIDARYLRPTEVDLLLGDPSRARQKLGWQPKVGFRELAEMMVESDLRLAEVEKRAGVDAGLLKT